MTNRTNQLISNDAGALAGLEDHSFAASIAVVIVLSGSSAAINSLLASRTKLGGGKQLQAFRRDCLPARAAEFDRITPLIVIGNCRRQKAALAALGTMKPIGRRCNELNGDIRTGLFVALQQSDGLQSLDQLAATCALGMAAALAQPFKPMPHQITGSACLRI